jgi:transposase
MGEGTRALMARVGVDIAKTVVHVHAVDGAGRRVLTRALKREQFLPWCAKDSRKSVLRIEQN